MVLMFRTAVTLAMGHKRVSGSDTIVFLLALPDSYTNVAFEETQWDLLLS